MNSSVPTGARSTAGFPRFLFLVLTLFVATSACSSKASAPFDASRGTDTSSTVIGSGDGTDAPIAADRPGAPSNPSATLTPIEVRPPRPIQMPIGLSDDGADLVDATGLPVFVNGDAAWSLLVQLDSTELHTYLAERARQGFNTLLVNLIEHYFSASPPANAAGVEPFASPGDFTQPVDEYFDAAHDAIEAARDAGFIVFLVPAYLGYDGGEQGWYADEVAAGPDAMRSYGRYLGRRFGDLDNVIWTHGGDFAPPTQDLDLINALRDGLIEGGASQLHTAHWQRDVSSTDVAVDWLDLNLTYTSGPPYIKSLEDDQIRGLPHLLAEGQYEGVDEAGTPQRVRSEAYQAVLSGAIGYIYGNDHVWHFSDGWSEQLDAPGATDMTRFASLFESLRWNELDPSLGAEILENPGEVGASDYVVNAMTGDRSLMIAYVPEPRDLILDLGVLGDDTAVVWFDPTSGEQRGAEISRMGEGRFQVSAPDRNARGTSDWVFILRRAAPSQP